MELQEFTKKTVKALEEFYGGNVEVKTHSIYKNNGILLQGVCALEQGMNIAPTVYLNDFLSGYEEGETFGEIIRKIVEIIENNKVAKQLDVNFFMDYEQVKKKLVLRLINREKNVELLKQVPYLKFEDLAIVCHCVMITEEIGNGSILIYKQHLENWNITEDTLFHDAFKNSPAIEPYSILRVSEMMKNILRDNVREQMDEICDGDSAYKEELLENTLEAMMMEIEEKHIPMSVLTNSRRYYGAASLVYPGVLETIGEMLQDDFYILPSSVHEVIFLGKSEGMEVATLNDMIEEVNRTQVEEEDWLADHAYYYDRKRKFFVSV